MYSYTAENYVKNFYQSALNRQPTTNELQSHLSTLQTAYAQGPAQFMTGMQNLGNALFTSQEYINRNRTDSQYVYDLYKAYLYREPDQGGWDFWTGQVAINGRDQVRLGFALSVEFDLKVKGISPYSPTGGAVPRDGWEAIWYESTSNRVAVAGWNYDAAGNQTRVQISTGWQHYQYDAANRLVKVKLDDPNGDLKQDTPEGCQVYSCHGRNEDAPQRGAMFNKGANPDASTPRWAPRKWGYKH